MIDRYNTWSAYVYMVTTQTHVQKEWKHDFERINMLKMARYIAIHSDRKKAPQASLDQIRALIGNLALPAERAIFQQYVLANRFSEPQEQLDSFITTQNIESSDSSSELTRAQTLALDSGFFIDIHNAKNSSSVVVPVTPKFSLTPEPSTTTSLPIRFVTQL